jgi:hypothetical protein
MAVTARRILLVALASRAAVLLAMVLSNWAFADLDSSGTLQSWPCASDQSAGGSAGE